MATDEADEHGPRRGCRRCNQSQIVIVGGYDGSSGSTEMATITGTVNGTISDSTAIAIDSNNTVSVAWRDGSYLQPDANGFPIFSFVGQADIYLAAKLSGQSWSLPSRLTTSSANSQPLRLAGQITCIWHTLRAGRWAINDGTERLGLAKELPLPMPTFNLAIKTGRKHE